jgi:hypothetical protein
LCPATEALSNYSAKFGGCCAPFYSSGVDGRLLGHKEASTTERYAHLATDPMRRAADQIANHLAAAMAGKVT